MNDSDKALAELVIRHLCVGAVVESIGSFGPNRQLGLWDDSDDKPAMQRRVYINVQSWTIYAKRPASFRGPGVPLERNEHGHLPLLDDLRGAKIREAELGESVPDLILTFEDARVFFVDGRHDRFEPWDLGCREDNRWLVVACPGDEVAVWAPPDLGT